MYGQLLAGLYILWQIIKTQGKYFRFNHWNLLALFSKYASKRNCNWVALVIDWIQSIQKSWNASCIKLKWPNKFWNRRLWTRRPSSRHLDTGLRLQNALLCCRYSSCLDVQQLESHTSVTATGISYFVTAFEKVILQWKFSENQRAFWTSQANSLFISFPLSLR